MAVRATTVGELKESGYRSRSVKDEIRSNLICALQKNETLFPGIVGYDDSVIPQVVNTLLARQSFILLGLRGQAKSRIIRMLVNLLDAQVPILAGSEINDDPLRPISKYGRTLVEEHGDDAPVQWIPRESRFVEKLATPDVTIADIIGDVDPIRAARGGHVLADELTIHYGLLPRANRGIFALNELPDLAGKIQVGLFNIMQEGDIQIKGYPVRLPLDVLLVFTANPEDYTARGKIITPLKDRIGSEVMTHYPEGIEQGVKITVQEAWLERDASDARPIRVPDFITETVERIAFLARMDKRVDQRSGVSQRLPISVLENAVSNAERRAIMNGEPEVVPRPTDIYAALPAITGKLELEYEGELVGGDRIARELVAAAAGETFNAWGGEAVTAELDEIVDYFERGGVLQVGDTAAGTASLEGFRTVPGLVEAVTAMGLANDASPGSTAAACELVLEALVAERRLSRSDAGGYGRAPRRPNPPGPQKPTFEV
ncbi:MAG: sigma 54-interacting transcriptional regulator [Gemmatimonadetes bacterium]|nr:sigma 54-interacting transcriptional regulator [Gemmatimonadota bacterium]